ncbi:MAG: hypothetical protein J6N15_02445 [Ruminiclostridium sp.]|nr:hypothetical protein [Ruminiclostridium sp.]
MARASSNVAVIKDGAVYVLKAGTPVYVGTADICTWTGKTKQWIGQLTKQGVLERVQTEQGQLYNAGDTVNAYLESIADKVENSETEQEKKKAEMSLKKSKAAIAAMEVLELKGKMHRSEDVADMTEDLVYAIRNSLLALPGRLAVDLAEMSEPAEISNCIRNEIYKIMDELSRYEYNPAKYEERVRERLKYDARPAGDDSEEDE